MFTIEELRCIEGQMAYALDGLEDPEAHPDHVSSWAALASVKERIAAMEAAEARRRAKAFTLDEALRECEHWGLQVKLTFEPGHIVKGDGVHEFAEFREDNWRGPGLIVRVSQHPEREAKGNPPPDRKIGIAYPYGTPTTAEVARALEALVLGKVRPDGVRPDLTPRVGGWVCG